MSDPVNPSKSRLQSCICLLMVLFGLYIFVMQMWNIHALWTPVGLVDAWPLYHRLMKFMTGQLNLNHYLLDPHVHPHSIVYFLYLIDVMFGSGRQLVPHFATLLSIIALVSTLWLVVWQSSSIRLSFNLRSCAFFIGTLVLLSGLSEATVIPFQTVVCTTRFTYIFLLAVLVYCQFRPNIVLHTLALATSMVAVSFYASGGVFAAEIILLHLVFYRRWGWFLSSFLPLVVYLLLIAFYTHAGAETAALKAIIYEMNFTTIARTGLGSICYYASALVGGWPKNLGPGYGISEITAFGIGFLIYVATVTWAAYTLFSLFLKGWWRKQTFQREDVASCLMALVSLSVFVSSLSAALLWQARAKIFGASMQMPAHYAVLTSNRYAAFSSLAFVVFLFIAMNLKHRVVGTILSSATFFLICFIGLNSLNSRKMQENAHYYRDNIEYAATALLMGMSPADPEASAVFPGVSTDWYWPVELPKAIAYLHSKSISYSYNMPQLSVVFKQPRTTILEYETQPVAEKPEFCRLTGSAESTQVKDLYAPQRFFPITVESGAVVGYALRAGTTVKGHILCGNTRNKQPLFLSAQN